MPIYEFDIEGDFLKVEVPEGWDSPELLEEIYQQERGRKQAKDIDPISAAGVSAYETIRKSFTPIKKRFGLEDPGTESYFSTLTEEAREQQPVAATIGGMAPYMAMPYSTVPKAAASGAAAGLLESEVDPYQDPRAAVIEAAKGGVLGAGITGATSRLIGGAQITEPARRLMAEGIQPTVGQAKGGMFGAIEEKVQSVPFIGDAVTKARTRAIRELNVAALRRSSPPGVKLNLKDKTIREAVSELSDRFDEAYKGIYQGKTFPLRSKDAEAMQRTINDPQYLVPNEIRENIANHLRATLEPGQEGAMYSGEILSRALSEMRRRGREMTRSAVGSERDQGRMYNALAHDLERWRNRNLTPKAQREAKAIDRSYANYKRVERAASYVGQDDMFTPAQLQSAVKAVGGASQFAKDRALMEDLSSAGRQVLATKVPDSGTATRLATAGGLGGLGFGTATGAVNPAILTAYGLGTLGSWLGHGRVPQRYMTGGYPWQAPAARMLTPIAGRTTPMMLKD